MAACAAVQQFQASPLESRVQVGVLRQQPRSVRGLLADQRTAGPADLIHDRHEPGGVVAVHLHEPRHRRRRAGVSGAGGEINVAPAHQLFAQCAEVNCGALLPASARCLRQRIAVAELMRELDGMVPQALLAVPSRRRFDCLGNLDPARDRLADARTLRHCPAQMLCHRGLSGRRMPGQVQVARLWIGGREPAQRGGAGQVLG
jgi:hypothetical protein